MLRYTTMVRKVAVLPGTSTCTRSSFQDAPRSWLRGLLSPILPLRGTGTMNMINKNVQEPGFCKRQTEIRRAIRLLSSSNVCFTGGVHPFRSSITSNNVLRGLITSYHKYEYLYSTCTRRLFLF